MPLTPFIGLSVLIHVSIIALHGLFHRFKKTKVKVTFKVPVVVTGIASSLVAVIVFLFVGYQAISLVHRSIIDKHSSVHLIKRYVAQYEANHTGDGGAIALAATTDAAGHMCSPLIAAAIASYDSSLVDFMKDNDMDSSFTARKNIAQSLGIENYQGTNEQNRKIFHALLIQAGILGDQEVTT